MDIIKFSTSIFISDGDDANTLGGPCRQSCGTSSIRVCVAPKFVWMPGRVRVCCHQHRQHEKGPRSSVRRHGRRVGEAATILQELY